jgi:hypothetical protein
MAGNGAAARRLALITAVMVAVSMPAILQARAETPAPAASAEDPPLAHVRPRTSLRVIDSIPTPPPDAQPLPEIMPLSPAARAAAAPPAPTPMIGPQVPMTVGATAASAPTDDAASDAEAAPEPAQSRRREQRAVENAEERRRKRAQACAIFGASHCAGL